MPYHFTTSGTSGSPKSFTVSDALMAGWVNSRDTAKAGALSGVKSLFCDLPPGSRSEVIFNLWARKNNVKYYNNGGGTIQSALNLFQSQAIDCIVANPRGLLNYASAGGNYKFKSILSMGSILMPTQSVNIRSGLGDNLFTAYGTSEMGAIATGTAAQAEAQRGCVGNLCPGVMVDFDNGQVKVKTSNMISGYDDSSLNAKYFKDGWFYPGDMGSLSDEGLLIISGRVLD